MRPSNRICRRILAPLAADVQSALRQTGRGPKLKALRTYCTAATALGFSPVSPLILLRQLERAESVDRFEGDSRHPWL